VVDYLLSKRAYPYFAAAIILLAGVAAYSDSLNCSFHFDDETSIIYNQSIRNPWDWKAIWTSTPTRFVTYWTFALNRSIGGLDVLGYHLVNLALHLGTALLVWWLAFLTFRTPSIKNTPLARHSKEIALFAGLLFAVHPIQTQAVTYIAQRAASLATLFYTATLLLYCRARLADQGREGSLRPFWLYAGAGCTAIIGFLTKEIIVTLPFAVLLYEFSFFRSGGRIRWKFLGGIFLLFAAVLGSLVAKGLIPLADTEGISRVAYLMTEFKVVLIYIKLLILPIGQNLDYDVAISSSFFESSTIIGFLAIVALVLIGLKLFKDHRVLAFGVFWFLLTLVPESSVFPIRDVIYEHRLYLPMVGCSMLLAALPFSLQRWISARFAFSLLLLVVVGFGYLTFERNKVWKDDWTLWNDVIRKSPNKARGYNNRGRAFLDAGAVDRALADFDVALALDPQHGPAYNNRGNAFLLLGQYDKAIEDYDKALEAGVTNTAELAQVYYNLGLAYRNKGENDLALQDLNKALSYDPYHAEAYYNRAIVRTARGDYQGALEDYTRTLALTPMNANALNNRGVVYKMLGEYPKAIEDFDHAIQIQPTYADAYFNRGSVRNSQQKCDSAIADFSQVIQFRADDPRGYNGRALAYYIRKEYGKALFDYTHAIDLNPQSVESFRGRALVYFAMKNLRRAREDLSRAESLGLRDPFLDGFIRGKKPR
jgi:tetratricopeptide (TPR) repeat protein